MIFVTGYGQMCNNILQLAHYYAWAKNRNQKVIGLRFCYKYLSFEISNQFSYNWFTYIFAKYGAKWGMISRVSFMEESDITEENLKKLETSSLVFVSGWFFRDYDAFLQHRNEIKELFAFKKKIIGKVNSRLSFASSKPRIGVHIRRGDYVRWQGGKYYFSDEEYSFVISSFLKNSGFRDAEVWIVSNDKSLRQEVYQKNLDADVFFLSGSAAEDLYTLSICDYLIGPPSTFSLMASFYQDIPLYWIHDKTKEVTVESFGRFEELFRQIL